MIVLQTFYITSISSVQKKQINEFRASYGLKQAQRFSTLFVLDSEMAPTIINPLKVSYNDTNTKT
ncbi:hypothetical protein BpHYR1_045589 [Brachionus plicatilis]|uniref:Uncharacterized protein n=1 Tax=Brachionus plicatilis TaxID=10195 RepID=A0A3M7QQK2_BRAPC|nr:hypothetical protein BpHYR1_045589 [Brachionus plicatilis]